MRELEALADRPIYYIDECGIEHGLYRENARARRGVKVYAEISGTRKRTSIIGAWGECGFLAPMLFEGSCTTELIDAYFEKVLLPELPKGSIIILDNARFHQSASTRRLVESDGKELMFLPAYSPDLNPIEHFWAKFKNALKPRLHLYKNKLLFIAKMSQSYC